VSFLLAALEFVAAGWRSFTMSTHRTRFLGKSAQWRAVWFTDDWACCRKLLS
jgi:hypothetical protein